MFNVSLPAIDSQEYQLVGHSRQSSFFSVSWMTIHKIKLLTLHLVIFTNEVSQFTLHPFNLAINLIHFVPYYLYHTDFKQGTVKIHSQDQSTPQ